MNPTSGSVRFGSEVIEYEVVERPRRRTLGVEVHPDGRVLVLAPMDCDVGVVEQKLRLRAGWISRQLAVFSRFERGAPPRHYVSGEAHRYLGRQYRLRVVANDPGAKKDHVRLTRGEIVVAGPGRLGTPRVKELLQRWYRERAKEVYERLLEEGLSHWTKRAHSRPPIVVREMRSRWGSLSPAGRMTLNARLIQAPRRCIEYVIAHELCHMSHRNHDANFFQLLQRVMPDWRARKERLEVALL